MSNEARSHGRPWNMQMASQLSGPHGKLAFEAGGDAGCDPLEWELPDQGNLSFGVTVGTHLESGEEVFQFNEDRYRHTIILGRTGAGKSNHVQQMEREDIRNGAGCFILAAHEDDAIYPLSCVPESRLDDVVLIDASNPEYLPRMNPLDVDLEDRSATDKAVSDVRDLLTLDMPFDWAGPRFEQHLRGGLGLIMEPGYPHRREIADLYRLFTDPEHVKSALEHCTRRNVYDFWTKVFPGDMKSSDGGAVVAWFLAKISRFADDRALKHVFGAGRSTVDMQDVVDNGKILVAYVPESRIGSAAARTISRWLVMQLRDAIMNRGSALGGWKGLDYGLFEAGGRNDTGLDPFFVYVDEFAKFASPDFELMLAEARKQHVGFVLSTQTMSQTRTLNARTHQIGGLEEAILGNVGSMVCYPVGTKDADLLSSQFDVDAGKLRCIDRYRPLARLCMENRINRPGTLEVGMRPEPDNPSAPRRIALRHVRSGAWVRVEGGPGDDGFAKAVEGKGERKPARPVPGPSSDGRDSAATASPADIAGSPGAVGDSEEAPAPKDGLGVALRYWDPTAESFALTPCTAQQELAICGDGEPVWAIYRHGRIVRAATREEYQEELEVRIGGRISARLDRGQLAAFDAISDSDEASRWLAQNCPEYRADIAATLKEMESARVLDPDDVKTARRVDEEKDAD